MLSWISRMSIPSTGRKSIGITFAPYWSRSFAGMFRLTSRSYRLYERPIRMTAWAPAFSNSEIANAPRPETREEILDQEAFVVPEADGRGQELLAHLLLPAGNRRQDEREGLPPRAEVRLGMGVGGLRVDDVGDEQKIDPVPQEGGHVAVGDLDRVTRLGDGLLESLSRNRLVGSRAHLQVEPQTGKEGLPEREPTRRLR